LKENAKINSIFFERSERRVLGALEKGGRRGQAFLAALFQGSSGSKLNFQKLSKKTLWY
jgi:hypothetical protein